MIKLILTKAIGRSYFQQHAEARATQQAGAAGKLGGGDDGGDGEHDDVQRTDHARSTATAAEVGSTIVVDSQQQHEA